MQNIVLERFCRIYRPYCLMIIKSLFWHQNPKPLRVILHKKRQKPPQLPVTISASSAYYSAHVTSGVKTSSVRVEPGRAQATECFGKKAKVALSILKRIFRCDVNMRCTKTRKQRQKYKIKKTRSKVCEYFF